MVRDGESLSVGIFATGFPLRVRFFGVAAIGRIHVRSMSERELCSVMTTVSN